MDTLKDKIALITGAGRGIGRAIAEKLAADGADLVLCDLKTEWLADTEKSVAALGRKVLCLACDVSNAAQVEQAVDGAVAAYGRIDILVNNAGITKDGYMVRMSEDDWDAVLDINLKGTFLVTKFVAKVMMKQQSGNIINIASIIGLIGNTGQCNYAASKAGVIAFTKTSAKEFASRNIRANAVAPGFIDTKMTEVLKPEIKQKMLDAIPMGRFGKPEDVAGVVAFLASDVSKYVTGQVINISGGMVM